MSDLERACRRCRMGMAMKLAGLLAVTFPWFIAAHIADASDLAEDTGEILALHEKILQAHRENNVGKMMENASDEYILVTRGEVLYPTLAEREGRFDEYFAITTFDSYEDTIDPIVKISADGTLAWLVARVSVTGSQTHGDEELPVDFTSAWIELYEKRDGKWAQVGNVSNFKPQ